jgi:hypothetical protein
MTVLSVGYQKYLKVIEANSPHPPAIATAATSQRSPPEGKDWRRSISAKHSAGYVAKLMVKTKTSLNNAVERSLIDASPLKGVRAAPKRTAHACGT